MPSYEEQFARFEGYNAQVVGISVDSTYANAAWAKSLGGINYPLLSDFYPHGAVAQTYGVFRKEGMAERAIVIVDAAGVVRYGAVYELSEVPDEERIFDELHALA